MGDNSKVEWTATRNPDGTVTPGATWNPIAAYNKETGKRGWFCNKVSPECTNCYAERMNENTYFGNGLSYSARNLSQVEFKIVGLDQPLRWQRPRKIFVCSMTDLFHSAYPDQWIIDIYGIMVLAHWHTLLVLTKRIERAANFLQSDHGIIGQFEAIQRGGGIGPSEMFRALNKKRRDGIAMNWPPSNIRLGVSVGDQETADERREAFKATPAAVKFVSYEPALGPVDWSGWEFVDQIIAGGESGPDSRPSHPKMFRDTRDWCRANNVKFFFKQWGNWKPVSEMDEAEMDSMYYPRAKSDTPDSTRRSRYKSTVVLPDGSTGDTYPHGAMLTLDIGKKKAGRLLDGVEHNEMPECAR